MSLAQRPQLHKVVSLSSLCPPHLSRRCLANCHCYSLADSIYLISVWRTAIFLLCVLSISLSSLSGKLPLLFSVSSPSLSRRCLANCHFSSLCPLHLSLVAVWQTAIFLLCVLSISLSLVAVWQTAIFLLCVLSISLSSLSGKLITVPGSNAYRVILRHGVACSGGGRIAVSPSSG
jgi:hypothetical protein